MVHTRSRNTKLPEKITLLIVIYKIFIHKTFVIKNKKYNFKLFLSVIWQFKLIQNQNHELDNVFKCIYDITGL
jgi:hypothetical protein